MGVQLANGTEHCVSGNTFYLNASGIANVTVANCTLPNKLGLTFLVANETAVPLTTIRLFSVACSASHLHSDEHVAGGR
jgi:hypothetical protein